MRREDYRDVSRLIAKVKRRLMGLITRSKVTASVTDTQGQSLTVAMLQGQVRDAAEYFEPYGVAGAVPTGAEGLAFAVGGSRDQVVVVCASPKGGTPEGRLPGEVDIYSAHGQRIRLHTDGSVSILPGQAGAVYVGSDVNPATPAAARNGDPVVISETWAAWAATVGSFVGAAPPGAAPIGNVSATSTKVKVG